MAGLGPATHVRDGPEMGKSWVAKPGHDTGGCDMTRAGVSRFRRSIFSAAGIAGRTQVRAAAITEQRLIRPEVPPQHPTGVTMY
jgi:hypothetical protein